MLARRTKRSERGRSATSAKKAPRVPHHVAKTKMLTKLPAFAVYSAESGKQAAPGKSVGSKARPATARKAGTPVAMQTVQEEDEYVLV